MNQANTQQMLLNAAELLKLSDVEHAEQVADAATRTLSFEYYDALGIHIHVWHSGLGKQPWMLEIRKNGLLYGSFESVQPGFDTRTDAETQAFEVASSMVDGTFELRFTS